MIDVQSVITQIEFQMSRAENDYEVGAALSRCRASLAAIAWERFRLRHEAACAAKALAQQHAMFVRRHKR